MFKITILFVLVLTLSTVMSVSIEGHPNHQLDSEILEHGGEARCRYCCCGWCITCYRGDNTTMGVIPDPALPDSLRGDFAPALVPESKLKLAGEPKCYGCCCGWCISC